MKIARLKKLLLQAKTAGQQSEQKLKIVSQDARAASKELGETRQELKAARKRHKNARKHFRKLETALKRATSERKASLQELSKLEKKWRKAGERDGSAKAARAGRRKPAKIRKTSKRQKPALSTLPLESATFQVP